jgi:MFS family permease
VSAENYRQFNLEDGFRAGEEIGMGLGVRLDMNLGRRASIMMATLAMVAALGLWFSASAIVPALRVQENLDPMIASLFSSAVQVGFVCGTIISAVLVLADRLDPRRLFALSAVVAAVANLAILLFEPSSPMVILCRFITGLCMAGIYPVGMKLATTWAKGDMGFLVGILVGALTLGSAAPHLFNALAGVDWRATIVTASANALVAAVLVLFVSIGPNTGKTPPFRPSQALAAWRNKSLRYANLGYLGHMWELYAMWTWIGVFLFASFRLSMTEDAALLNASLATFGVISVGVVGCVLGGLWADRIGRTIVTMISMAVSGTCAILVGFLFGGDPVWLMGLCLVWGIAIVADSAQFSASIAELSDKNLVGTMLTVQTGTGFLLTLGTIHVVPVLVDWVGWTYAFAFLAIGPFLGVIAMGRLRTLPEARKIAGGRR